jgi:tetratricopeptide (TPR) repeat protein
MKRPVLVLLLLAILPLVARAAAPTDPMGPVERALQRGQYRDAMVLATKIADDASSPAALRGRALRARALVRHLRLGGLDYAADLEQAVIADPDDPSGPGLLQLAAYEHYNNGPGTGWSGRVAQLRPLADARPWLLGASVEMQARERRMAGRFDEAAQRFDELHPVRRFLVTGPFDDAGGSGIDEVYPVEERLAPDPGVTDRHGRPVSWLSVTARDDGRVDVDEIFDNEPNAVAYAVVQVRADHAMDAVAHVGGGGSFRLWIGDRLFLDEAIVRAADCGFYEVPVTLQEGWNRVLVKLGAEKEVLRFLLRFSDPDGRPLALETRTEGILTGPGPAAAAGAADLPALPNGLARYPAPTGGPTGPPRPGESWLRTWHDRALAGTGITDLALLVLDLQLRDLDDDASVLVDTIQARFPGVAIGDYLRARAMDEQSSEEGEGLLRRLATTTPELLMARVSMVKRALDAKEEDRLMADVDAMRQLAPDDPMLLVMHAGLMIAKGSATDGLEELRQARAATPGNTVISRALLQILKGMSRDSEYEQVMRQTLEARPDLSSSGRQIASVAYQAKRYDEAIGYLRQALATGQEGKTILMEMGIVFEMAGRTDSAIAMLEEAQRRAPMAADVAGQLASVYIQHDRKQAALPVLNRQVQLDPTAFEAREMIRKLEGKPPLRERFQRDDALALAKQPALPADSSANVVYLLDAVDVIHYPDGAEESWHHVVRRLLTREAVDDNGKENAEGDIELARIIKPDGREIDAKTTQDEVAFTGLEPGDVTDVIYRWPSAPVAGMPACFWERHIFQGPEPTRTSRFSLLLPDSLRYRSERHNGAPAARSSAAGGWRLDVWEARDVPCARREEGGPTSDETDAWLDVSSVPSWDDIVRWYDRASRQRTRATPAIRALASRLAEGDTSGIERVRRVVDYVKENVRYEGGSLVESAHIPRSADAVLRTRYGDCKDQACLIVSLLRELGIGAHFALVNGRESHTVPYLPSARFNHAIARAGGRGVPEVWVDTTDPDLVFPNVPVQLEGARALLVDPAAPAFVTIGDDSAEWNGCDSRLSGALDASGDLKLHGDARFVGEDAARYRSTLRRSPESRDELAKNMVVADHPGAEASALVLDTGGQRTVGLTYGLRIPAAAARAGGFLMLPPPWTIETVPHDLVSLETRKLPLLLDSWKGRYHEEITLQLPAGYELAELREPVDVSCPIGAFRLAVRRGAQGEVVLDKTLELNRVRVEPAEYPAFREFLTKAWRAEREQLVLKSAGGKP